MASLVSTELRHWGMLFGTGQRRNSGSELRVELRRSWTNRDGSRVSSWLVVRASAGRRHIKTFDRRKDGDAHRAAVAMMCGEERTSQIARHHGGRGRQAVLKVATTMGWRTSGDRPSVVLERLAHLAAASSLSRCSEVSIGRGLRWDPTESPTNRRISRGLRGLLGFAILPQHLGAGSRKTRGCATRAGGRTIRSISPRNGRRCVG